MNLSEVYKGTLQWADYLREQARRPGDENLRAQDAHQQTADVARLSADFSLLLGDVIWQLEMQQQTLRDALHEIRLAEFEREARAFRLRAERAYLNGWYEEALQDFLAAAERNYPDYAVLRSIAHIYLYHLINLPQALAYFRKAAKYARPADPRSAAEAHFFAGVICLIEQQPDEAWRELQEATDLNPQFYEAHYQRALAAAIIGEGDSALGPLEQSIRGDARYYERAKNDELFAAIRAQVESLLARLALSLEQRVERVKREAGQLQGYVIAQSEQEKLSGIFQTLAAQQAAALTYPDRVRMLEGLERAQDELSHIHERFDKRYAIDPRDYVRSIAFSNQGHLLSAGFLYGGVQLWEVDSMMQLRAGAGHYASVNSVAFSPNDLLLVTGSRDRAIKLWEADSGKEIQILRGHTAEVRAVTFSPDGQWLVSGSHDKTIRLWRAATGHEVETLRGHTRPVTSVLFSPDGRMLVSGSWDHTIRLWDLESGRTASILTGHSKGLASLSISPDGRWLASGGEGGEVKMWDLRTGREVHHYTGLRNSVTSVAFSPDGALLAAGSLGVRIMVWNAATAEVVRTLEYDNISYNSVAFSPRGQWLAFGNRDLQLWLKVILTEEEYAAVRAGAAARSGVTQETEVKPLPGYVRLLNC